MEGRPTPLGTTRSSTDLPGYLQVPPLPLHTIKVVVVLGGEVPHSFPNSPSFSKLSSLA
jgi:hypothetical protein